MKKYLSPKHFKKIINTLSKIKGIDFKLLNDLKNSYCKNYLSNTKANSIFKNILFDSKLEYIVSYSFEDENYKLDKLNAKYLTIRYYINYTDKESHKYGKHRLFKKRYFLG